MSCPDAAAKGASVSPPDSRRRRASLPRAARIVARRDFERVYTEGRRAMGESFVLLGRPNALGLTRLGLTVSRKCGGAVTRNRIKRMLREVFRRHRSTLTPDLDLVANVRPAARSKSIDELENEFLAQHTLIRRRFGR